MKKVIMMMAAALVSVAMWAGENDLLWDFTEAAPGNNPVAASNNPDVKLTYESKVNDAAGTNNGLRGIKLNSSGYAYFTKAAVAGNLKLSYGPRSGSNKASLEVFTWDGETAAATTSIAKTTEVTELQTVTVELTEAQNNIYIKRLLNTETVLTKIQFKEGTGEEIPDSCDVIFKDQNGNELGRLGMVSGESLAAIPYTEADLPAFTDAEAFRGWFYTNGKKAAVGDVISGNTTIQAKVTAIELATIGSVQTYDFASPIFYPEDHETIEVNGGAYYNNHGWYFAADGSIDVEVAGNAVVVVTLCTYSETGDVVVKNGGTEIARTGVVKNGTEGATADGTEFTAQYKGEATTLTISWTAKQYIHKVTVYNVLNFVEKDAKTGYLMVPSGDAAAFILALVQAEDGDKIFLPNGTYDLGEETLTTISKNNISLIGQSMEGVIIRNAPDYKTESIDKTATLRIAKSVSGTYLQDLTLQNALDYYKNNNGRAVALWDQGTKTVCKNVRLLSYQDTYYSNLVKAVRYFEDCEIHGTVDFICGDGSVYFKNTELVCEQRSTGGGGSDALTASNADANDKGYVFEGCSVRYADNIQGAKPVVSLGRSWNNKPKTVFLNTVLADDLVMTKDASAQKDKIERWTLGAMNILPEKFGEYNSLNAAGQVVSPESNNVTFVLGSEEKTLETILTAEEAATYTMAYTLGDWSATAAREAKQAVCDLTNIDADGTYLIETENGCTILTGSDFQQSGAGVPFTVRKANARGGFGWKAGEEPAEGIENTAVSNSQVKKIMRDGQVYLMYEGTIYNVQGVKVNGLD